MDLLRYLCVWYLHWGVVFDSLSLTAVTTRVAGAKVLATDLLFSFALIVVCLTRPRSLAFITPTLVL